MKTHDHASCKECKEGSSCTERECEARYYPCSHNDIGCGDCCDCNNDRVGWCPRDEGKKCIQCDKRHDFDHAVLMMKEMAVWTCPSSNQCYRHQDGTIIHYCKD